MLHAKASGLSVAGPVVGRRSSELRAQDRGRGRCPGSLIISLVTASVAKLCDSGLSTVRCCAVATVLSLIPIFGSIISAIPAVALGLTQSMGTAVFVLVWIIGIHQIEANFLNPKIMGDAAKIHPVLVIFSLLVGEHFFHTMGALLAVPCMSIAQSIFTHVRSRIQAAIRRRMSLSAACAPPPDTVRVGRRATPEAVVPFALGRAALDPRDQLRDGSDQDTTETEERSRRPPSK